MRALTFARALEALQRAHRWSPDVACAIMAWRSHAAPAARAPPPPTGHRWRHARCVASSSAPTASLTAKAAASQPQLPLCEREAAHEAALSELLAWRDAARRQVEAVGDSWAQQDEGPSAEDLQTELNWLLDDSLAAWSQPGGDWCAIGWQQLERELRDAQRSGTPAAAECRVQLREPLDTLAAVWDQRLRQRVPLQYLTATAFWRDVVLSVGPGVLIPRPETELIIDFVREAVAAAPELAAGPWVDMGTGSGALAVGVARVLPEAPAVYAVDLSPVPLAYAAFNAARLGVGGRVRPLQGSWFEPLEAAGAGRLAGVVSNPPYISSAEMPGLQAEVGRHEPHLALHGGEGLGIDCLLPICVGAARLLRPGGLLALETAGGEQARYIADLLAHMRCSALGSAAADGITGGAGGAGAGERLAFTDVRVRRDLRGVDRFVTASRAPQPPPDSNVDAA